MRVLVTGATGFIGRHVIEYLLSKGYSVIATSRRRREDAVSMYPFLNNAEYISKDIYDEEKDYYTFFGKPDCLIHIKLGRASQL